VTPGSRILVIGPGGAGKTVFSKKLGEALDLPVVHLDALYWRAGWEPTPPDEWVRVVRRIAQEPSWVMDGNYGGTLEIRLARADAVIFLDVPRLTCVRRVLWRRIVHSGRSRPSMPRGCPERVTWGFISWIWTYGRRRRPRVLSLLEAIESEKTVVVLRSSREMREYLSRSRQSAAHGSRPAA
jgi:adenylate kinase family enzyme